MKSIIIIPAYEPELKFVNFVKDILDKKIFDIVVVNDGSSEKKESIFDSLKKMKKVTVLTHEKNKGKGASLKTAFKYILEKKKNTDIVITADCDGQHLIKDILKVHKKICTNPEKFVLGIRTFEKNTPIKSLIGNKISSLIMKFLYNIKLSDTQTGLRAFSKKHLEWLTKIKTNRFEYELDVLILSKKEGYDFDTVPIKTVYIKNNKGSHYKAFKDSFKIGKQLLKGIGLYAGSSILSALIDILIFTLLVIVLNPIYSTFVTIAISTGIARIISSLINFNLNAKVFTNSLVIKTGPMIRYYILWSVQLIMSILFVNMIASNILANKVTSKLLVDIVLYIISYQVQLRWVFKIKKK